MFRNPRENAALKVDRSILPSTGRPPTPPNDNKYSVSNASPYFSLPSNMTGNAAAPSPAPTPVLGRQPYPRVSSAKKNGFRQNQSILSFFGKSGATQPALTAPEDQQRLFFEEAAETSHFHNRDILPQLVDRIPSPPLVDDLGSLHDLRYNEIETPIKRRKTDDPTGCDVRTPSPARTGSSASSIRYPNEPAPQKVVRHRGGFLDDSDDDSNDDDDEITEDATLQCEEKTMHSLAVSNESDKNDGPEYLEADTTSVVLPKPPEDQDVGSRGVQIAEGLEVKEKTAPTLNREGTSVFDPGDFEDADDFENDEFFEEGEEYLERRWMQEQREMEMAFDEDSKSESGGSVMTPIDHTDFRSADEENQAAASCPICSGSLAGLSETDTSTHVNACLDGTAPPLPKVEERQDELSQGSAATQSSTPRAPHGSDRWQPKRFQRAAIARPGQTNPFSFAKDGKSGGSAFSKLMSGHAEDAAWAEAAANEAQSRGKPAYQRTCPFYKIMPGLYICVDAFRYGKVEGQNAYFLSHFHSDHYIGLTSSWCHGPIYASKVTTNLMRQQLRVDAKWLVPLDFEKKTEVPNTKGVFVTMLPANHCPGSSLYLFEKVTGRNKDGSPKFNRILHCGDFRACPAHVKHPLLRPDVVDAISGQTKEQMIDTCYLDTTYLTPKYAFPSQHDVIDACAQMCVSLSKEAVDASDSWEKTLADRAGGSTMAKFLDQGAALVKKEDNQEEALERKPKLRGRLLVVIGTYSIGKERICLGIAKALNSKIFAPPAKMRICGCLEDAELSSLLTSNPLEAQVHMQTLMEIRAETLHDYLVTYRGHFSRVVGFRPTGWSYRPPTSRFTENPAVNTVLHSEGWKSRFTMRDLTPQRGSTKESNCFGVPYSEHSSFRELTMFCCALRIGRVVPTVNVGSARSREKMKGWIEKWDAEKKKNGLFKVEVDAEGWGSGDGKLRYGV